MEEFLRLMGHLAWHTHWKNNKETPYLMMEVMESIDQHPVWPSDFFMHTMACVHLHSHTHIHTHAQTH